jgi:magnesium chelatase subunit I
MITSHIREALLKGDVFSDILGQDEAKEQLASALISGRHAIIMGPPGIGKTTLAKNVAKLLPDLVTTGCEYNCTADMPVCPECKSGKKTGKQTVPGAERFVRIQGSPDLTAEDLLGDIDTVKALKFGAHSLEAFTPGKVFKANNGVLFFDELNRCPARLQNALLQVLEEKKATIGSHKIDLDADFIFIGTLNPQDASTETLSDVFADRVDMVMMHYPETQDIEQQIVIQKSVSSAEFPSELLDQTLAFIRALRESPKLEKFPSVRASIGLYERASANALLRGRKTVEQEDVRDAIISVLAHRIELRPSVKYTESTTQFLEEQMNEQLGAARGEYR